MQRTKFQVRLSLERRTAPEGQMRSDPSNISQIAIPLCLPSVGWGNLPSAAKKSDFWKERGRSGSLKKSDFSNEIDNGIDRDFPMEFQW